MKIKHLMISLMIIVGLFLFSTKMVSAEDTTTVKTVTGSTVTVAENNPFKIVASEILSFTLAGNVGVAGYVSQESGQFQPALAVQIGQSKHKWINYGINTSLSTTQESQNLAGIGAYAGINGVKVIEKALKKPLSDKISVTIGWTEMYYFSNTDKIDKGWDSGLFASVAIPF